MTAPLDLAALRRTVHELEAHAAKAGWDQPAQVFALVDTADLLRREPQLAEVLGADGQTTITPVEQEALAPGQELEDLLAEIVWPPEVAGCAVVVERLVLPPSADSSVPEDAEAARAYAAEHPDREEVRLVVGALRGADGPGLRWSALRMRSHDADDSVLSGADLVPGLTTLLQQTLQPDQDPDRRDAHE